MSNIKLEIVDSVTFRVSGKSYPRGKYVPEYQETATDENGVLLNENKAVLFIRPVVEINQSCPIRQVNPFKSPRKWTDFIDSNGDYFSDFQTFTDFVNEMISLPDEDGISFLTYVGVISQTSTSAPTQILKRNTLGATVSYQYIEVGEYLMNFSSAILTETNFGLIQGCGCADNLVKLQAIYNSPTSLKILCYDLGNVGNGATYETVEDSQVNDIINNLLIKLEVYN
jgi:hypothetical protein